MSSEFLSSRPLIPWVSNYAQGIIITLWFVSRFSSGARKKGQNRHYEVRRRYLTTWRRRRRREKSSSWRRRRSLSVWFWFDFHFIQSDRPPHQYSFGSSAGQSVYDSTTSMWYFSIFDARKKRQFQTKQYDFFSFFFKWRRRKKSRRRFIPLTFTASIQMTNRLAFFNACQPVRILFSECFNKTGHWMLHW